MRSNERDRIKEIIKKIIGKVKKYKRDTIRTFEIKKF